MCPERPLPLLALAVLASALVALRGGFAPKLEMRAAFASFALVLLLRIVLSARVQFYGFALAAPAVALFVLALVEWIPRSRIQPGICSSCATGVA